MSFKSPDALAASWTTGPSVRLEFPHPDGPVQATGHEHVAVRRECHRVDTVFVARVAASFFETLKQIALHVPDAHALVKTACSKELIVGRDCNGGDSVFYLERQDASVELNVPKTDSAVTGARRNVTAVGGVVERVDVLLVSGKVVTNHALSDVPDLAMLALIHAKNQWHIRG